MKGMEVALGLAEPQYPEVNLISQSFLIQKLKLVPSSAFAEEDFFLSLEI